MADTKELKIVSALQITYQVRYNVHICSILIVKDSLNFLLMKDVQSFSHFKFLKRRWYLKSICLLIYYYFFSLEKGALEAPQEEHPQEALEHYSPSV